MGQLPGRALAKLMIIPYSKWSPETGKLSALAGAPFIAMYNPTTFSINGGKEIATKVVAGTSTGGDIEDLYAHNRTLTVKLMLDGTGASPPLGLPVGSAFGAVSSALTAATGSSVSAINAEAAARAALSAVTVSSLVNFFFGIMANTKTPLEVKKEVNGNVVTVNEQTHTSNYLKLMWGLGLTFKCKLQSANVSYTLFNQLGQPLRGSIDATFIELPKKPTLFSPDLTKVHIVTAGDTIYNLARREYDDEAYYIKIAEVNGLKNYRRLIPGQRLILPPIAKVEE